VGQVKVWHVIGANPHVRLATEKDYEAAAEALALSFVDDPAWAHLLPNPETRGDKLLAFFMAEIGNLVPEYRQIWVTDDGSGAAIWASPGRWRVPFVRTLRSTRQQVGIFGRRLPLAAWTLLRMERHHPSSAHWYLNWLGVEPRRQGRGLGGALLAPMLERCDEERTPAYVEASTERNQALYERHGFVLTEAFPMPAAGPPIREMWRGPDTRGIIPMDG
jgi:ribosomal protein S18 acetylase RimI-like enzyme